MGRTVLVFYYGYCKNPSAVFCIKVGSNAFPLLQRKISHMVLLAMYRVCDYISLMSLVMFPEEGQSVTIVCNVARRSI